MTFLLVASLVYGTSAYAEDLTSPLALESEGRLTEALEAFEAALSRPGNSRSDLATIHLHLGLLRFACGDPSGALDSLIRLLAVEREVTLPGTAPPEVEELLGEARTRWEGRSLHADVEAETRVEEGAQAIVHVAVIDDFGSMVGGTRLVSGDEEIAELRGRGPYDIVVPDSAFVNDVARISVRLIDEHGGELWTGSAVSLERVARPAGPQPAPPLESPSRLRIAGWVLLAAGAATVTAGAVLVGVDSRPTGETQQLANGDYLEEQLDTAVGGWLLVSTGSAALIAAVVLLLIRPRASDHEAAALRLVRGVVAQW